MKNTTAIPDYIDDMGFDNVIREAALYAEVCANAEGQNEAVKRTFYRVMSVLAQCADDVEKLLVNPESMTIGLKQFQGDTFPDCFECAEHIHGSDGLPISVDENPRYNKGDKLAALELLWQLAEPVPAELIQKWSKGGGHNGAGSESKDFRNWGKTLKQPVFKKKQFLELKEKFSLLSACQ